MSREELSKTKYIRQQPAPDTPSSGKDRNRVKKPWILETRFIGAPEGSIFNQFYKKGAPWKKCGAYKTEKGIQQALLSKESDSWDVHFEYRVRFIG